MVAHGMVGTALVLSGIVALLSKKGKYVHRRSGQIFAVTLFLMALIILATKLLASNLVSTLGVTFTALVCYLVLTSWATMRMPPATLNTLSYFAPAMACSVGMMSLYFGLTAVFGYAHLDDDIPVAAFFVFSALAFLSAWGDFSLILKGGLVGAQRVARHLWRMCFAVYLFTATLFTGPGSIVFPDGIRGSWILMLPELSVLALGLYWMTKVLQPKTRNI